MSLINQRGSYLNILDRYTHQVPPHKPFSTGNDKPSWSLYLAIFSQGRAWGTFLLPVFCLAYCAYVIYRIIKDLNMEFALLTAELFHQNITGWHRQASAILFTQVTCPFISFRSRKRERQLFTYMPLSCAGEGNKSEYYPLHSLTEYTTRILFHLFIHLHFLCFGSKLLSPMHHTVLNK